MAEQADDLGVKLVVASAVARAEFGHLRDRSRRRAPAVPGQPQAPATGIEIRLRRVGSREGSRVWPAVEGRPLDQGAAQRFNDAAEVLGGDLGAVVGTGGRRCSRPSACHRGHWRLTAAVGYGIEAELHPRTLDVVDTSAIRDSGDGVHQDDLPEGRTATGSSGDRSGWPCARTAGRRTP